MVSLLQAGNLKSKSISNWGRQLSESYLDCLEDVSDPPSTPGLLQVHGRPGWSLGWLSLPECGRYLLLSCGAQGARSFGKPVGPSATS